MKLYTLAVHGGGIWLLVFSSSSPDVATAKLANANNSAVASGQFFQLTK